MPKIVSQSQAGLDCIAFVPSQTVCSKDESSVPLRFRLDRENIARFPLSNPPEADQHQADCKYATRAQFTITNMFPTTF